MLSVEWYFQHHNDDNKFGGGGHSVKLKHSVEPLSRIDKFFREDSNRKKKELFHDQLSGWMMCKFSVASWCRRVLILSNNWLFQGWDWPIYYLIYGGFYRTVWSICVAWLIYFCYFRRNSIINRFLSSRFFIPLSNLCYSVRHSYQSYQTSISQKNHSLPLVFFFCANWGRTIFIRFW